MPEPPTIEYVVASPRAALVNLGKGNANPHSRIVGAAENFARGPGRIKVPVGVRIVFKLHDELEGVWYEDAFGKLGTYLILQKAVPALAYDPNAATVDILDPNTPVKWVTIGRAGNSDIRMGPSIGRACIGVPARFIRPGLYRLRAIVGTLAQPFRPDAAEAEGQPKSRRARRTMDVDFVPIIVHVVDLSINDITQDEPLPLDPEQENAIPMPVEIGADEPEAVIE